MARLVALGLLLLASGRGEPPVDNNTTVIVVYGATPGGISAAIAASRALGQTGRVLLVEPSQWIGGMASGGLGCTDRVGESSYGGLAREFVNRTNAVYLPAGGGPRPELPHCETHTAFEPHVATEVFHAMLAEAGVELVVGSGIAQASRAGTRLTSIELNDGTTVKGSVFIDATYEGDLLAAAGVDFTVGREGESQYNEPLAGRRPLVPGICYGFQSIVDPFVSDATEQVLPLIWAGDLAGEGAGDAKVMSYNYRLCLTNATAASGGKRMELTKPVEYDPTLYELARRYLKVMKPPETLTPSVLKIYSVAAIGDGIKADVNSAVFPVSTNLVGGSWGYPNGSATERATIIDRHKSYTKGLLWFWKTDPAVPSHLRSAMAAWAWCRDEWVDNGHFPTQLYVREGRRMVGETVVTQLDATSRSRAHGVGTASIGVADYAFDVHPVEILASTTSGSATSTKRATVEGCTGGRPVSGGWQIPFAAITPKASQATNLLVPVALSASHVAFASIRLELTWMALGQSAGIAAALAATRGVPVQQVPLAVLNQQLLAAGQVLEPKK